jgi:hypothetical protein
MPYSLSNFPTLHYIMFTNSLDMETGSSGDYIQLLRKRAMKNQKKVLSNGNTTALNYATYLDQKDLASIDNDCFTIKAFNSISLNPSGSPCNYPANTFTDIIHVNQPIFSYNNDVGLAWKACYGSMGTNVNYVTNNSSFADNKTYDFTSITTATNNNSTISSLNGSPSPFTIEWFGYIFSPFDATYTFGLTVIERDNMHVWVGPNALSSNITFSNQLIKVYRINTDPNYNSPVTTTASYFIPANTYVPIRIQYDNTTGYAQGLNFAYKLSNSNDFIFSSDSFYYWTNNFSIVPLYSPLKSTPSVPGKLQTNKDSCASCTSYYEDGRHRRRWNVKKSQMLSIYDSRTFKM